MKKTLSILTVLLLTITLYAQTEEDKIKQVLNTYKSALEKLDVKGTEVLFTTSSQIIESGSVEGTYGEYLAHHIGPELNDFKSFKYENYKVDVTLAGDFAYAVETYNYTIVLKKDNSEIKRKGVATSILKKESGSWKIVHAHNSSRKP